MNRKRTQFKGGGLLKSEPTFGAAIQPPSTFPAPVYIDSKPYCLPASNQGQLSACAGYAMAGIIEVWNWQMNDIYQQVDGVTIYEKALATIGGHDGDGLSLDDAVRAAEALGLIHPNKLTRIYNLQDYMYAVHKNVVVLLGLSITENWNYVDSESGAIGTKANAEYIGGHAVVGCGDDTVKRKFTIQNSWGEAWGCNGFATIDFHEWSNEFMFGVSLSL